MRSILIVISALSVLLLVTPVSVAATPSQFLTTIMVPIAAGETVQQGHTGVSITLNNTFRSPIFVFVYLNLANALGQTVSVQVVLASISGYQSATFFFGLPNFAPGTYSATLFAVTTNGVPISNSTTVRVTI